MEIKIKKLHQEAQLPQYQTLHSAGADLYACLDKEVTLAPMEIKLIPTGFAMEIPEGYEAQIRPRSGLGVKGISVPNAPGTIDADYRGEVKVILINLSGADFTIQHHDRIAQMVIAPTVQAVFNFHDELSDTVRGSGGFGSTGVKK
jgi:dUTP pyrophosphatase